MRSPAATTARATTARNGGAQCQYCPFITTRTTLQQVVDGLGKYSRVRGSGIIYYEYDLPDGSAVLIGPEWPFDAKSMVQNVTFFPKESEIDLAP
jgi:hypothetical protein